MFLSMLSKKKILLTLIIVLIVSILAAGGFVWSSLQKIDDYKIPQQPEAYELKAGDTARTVVNDLLGNEFPSVILRLWCKLHEDLDKVQKGLYAIDGHKNIEQILKDMAEGNVLEKEYENLVVVEGSSWESIYEKIKKIKYTDEGTLNAVNVPGKFIRDCLQKDDLLKYVSAGEDKYPVSFEGLLMPATYPVFDDRPVTAVISRAIRDMAVFMKEHRKNREPGVTLDSPYEALILASIIERETLVDDERSLVAAVFYNRMEKKMRLQTDPTVMYGVSPSFRGKLTREMLNKDTPYNTYTRAGLPPTPICMPSKASVLAVLNPADSSALYFVAKGISPRDGHVFSNSLAEHNKAVAEYRKKVKSYYAEQKKAQKSEEDGNEKSKTDSKADPEDSVLTLETESAKSAGKGSGGK